MKNLFFTIFYTVIFAAGCHLNAQTFTNYTTADGLPDNFICGGVAVDTNNNKWFGTAAGVAKYDNSSWTVYTTADGLVDNFTNCIAVDKNNNVWVGTNSGVSKFNGTSWTSYTVADSLIDNGVAYIAGDMDGSVWFATTAGVSKLNGSTWTDYTTVQGLPTDVIVYIAIDPAGNKWFGTPVNGVSIYNNSTFVNLSMSTMDSLVDDNVNAIAFDNSGQKWLGTRYGISKLDNSNNWLTNYRPIDGLYNEWVQDIKIDVNNNVWVALFTNYNVDGGISVFNGNHWQSFSVAEGLADKQVIRLAVDKSNDVWVATGNGVSKLTNTIGINTNTAQTSFSVYPNPATDAVYVSHGNNAIQVEIYDVTGKLIKDVKLNANSNEIDVAEINPGMYILQITDNYNTTSTKLIKH
jgi:ligand-binding sensor domain-containing protein